MNTPDIGFVTQEKSNGRARIAGGEDTVVALADMTSNQLIRRARILEEVIELIGDVGADAVQMRDVAQRSDVALATVYRYFSSKDHLLAVALEDWQKRLRELRYANLHIFVTRRKVGKRSKSFYRITEWVELPPDMTAFSQRYERERAARNRSL